SWGAPYLSGPQVRPALVMAGAVGLALKDHGRDLTLEGLLATSAVATPTAGRRACRAQPDLLRSGRLSQSRGAPSVRWPSVTYSL
ncbi:MAG: hypothetical protein LC769_12605, partial [Chloroflexi bacterium]|nr:hypothetical protein [Chloroflexota bacterium]